MIIATVTRTKYKAGTNKIDYKIVKGQEVKPSVLRKLKEADRIAWTRTVDKDASVNRRIIGRQAALEALGYYSDVNLEAMMYISNMYTNRELLNKGLGQNKLMRPIEKAIIAQFGLEDRRIELQHTDDCKEGVEATVWVAWPLDQKETEAVREFLKTL